MRTPVTILVYALIAVSTAPAASVLPVNLEEMIERADRVFSGRVVRVWHTEDSTTRLPVRFTTFEVIRAIKGKPGATVTIKQLASRVPGQVSMAAGTPFFPYGQEFVLFLTPESALGFSNPIGLFQGRLPVVTEPGGQKKVLGAFTPDRLLSGLKNRWVTLSVLSAKAHSGAALQGLGQGATSVDYGQFMSILATMVGRRN
jgi:hypothetical protein